jgi:uncharacterized tellurite resistance protein B-like protein
MIKSLLQRIQQQLGSSDSTPAAEAARHDAIRIATAGLLLEVAHADDELHGDEQAHLLEHLRGEYGLDEATIAELLAEADNARKATIDHFGFANLLRTKTSLEQRIEVVKTMWRIVYADGRLTQNEEYLLRKLAGLLGLEHHVMIEAKVAVRRQMGIV